MVAIPGVMKPTWLDREWPVELIAAVCPAFAIVWSIREQLTKDEPSFLGAILFGAALLWLIALGVLKVFLARRRDKRRIRMESPADLVGCIQVLYHAVKHQCALDKDDETTLRATIHRVVKPDSPGDDPEVLEQVIPYIGGAGGGEGRRFSTKCGIIGLVARTHEPHVGWRSKEDYSAFLDELVSEWGYSKGDAKALTEDREAWLAVPINGDNEQDTIGVVYLDSKQRDLFGEDVQELVIRSCFGVAEYIRARYN
ncbi:MAG: hypothetical protein JSU86_16025 [Phycisphaerales bacterium]|nr:MAG: hypothetical protein JSU86_16025 [Phycisphaerales bacterium]